MSLFHLQFAVVARSKGGDARKVSAYQLAAKVERRDGKAYDFRRKAGEHVGSAVMLPEGAPGWAANPATLWQACEDAERRGDAQIARMVEIAIPREVPAGQRMDMIRAIVAPWIKDGMAAQIDLHSTTAADGEPQPHAHILLTMRRMGSEGLAAKKERDWNSAFTSDQGRAMRGQVADLMNGFMERHGIRSRVDHRTHAAQGVTTTPEPDVSKRAWKAHQADATSPAAAPVNAILAERAQRTTARRDATWEASKAAYAGAAAEHYAAERDRRAAAYKQRQQTEQAARQDMRAQQREERNRTYQRTQRGLIRTVALGIQGSGHAWQAAILDAKVQANRLTVDAPGEGFPDFDTWLDDQAAAGDPTARAAVVQRTSRRAWLVRKDPAEAARRAIADVDRAASRVLKTRPRGSVDDAEIFGATRGRIVERRDAAADAARDATKAVEAHRRTASAWRRLTDRGWRIEHVSLMEAAQGATAKASGVATRYDGDIQTARAAAQTAAGRHRAALIAWLARPDVRAAQAAQRTAETVRAAIDSGDQETIKAAASGTLHEAAQAARAARERQQADQVKASAAQAQQRQADQAKAVKEAQERAAEARRLAAAQQATAPTPDSAAPAPGYRRR